MVESSEPPTKSLPRLAAPLVVSFTLRFLFTFVDLTYAAVIDEDADAVAAIGLYIPFQGFYIALWVGLSAGFTANLSRAFGVRDEARVVALKRAMLRLLAVLVPVLMALGALLYALVPAMGLEPGLARAFRIYGPTVLIGMAATGFWSIVPDSVVKAHHDTKSTMVAGLLATGTNVALNTLFVFGFHWGVFGLAFATVLSRLPALGYALYRAAALEAVRRRPAWDRGARTETVGPLRSILVLSVPGGLTFGLTAIENSFVTGVLAALPDQKTAIATFGVYHQLSMLALMPAVACSVAVLPYVARAVPEGRHAAVRVDLLRTLGLAAAFALLFTVPAGFLFARPLAEFFVKQADVVLSPAALATLHLLPVSVLAALPFLMLRPVFEALHRPRLGVAVSIARFVVLSIPLVLAGRYLGPAIGLAPLTGVVAGLATGALAASWLTARLVARSLQQARADAPA